MVFFSITGMWLMFCCHKDWNLSFWHKGRKSEQQTVFVEVVSRSAGKFLTTLFTIIRMQLKCLLLVAHGCKRLVRYEFFRISKIILGFFPSTTSSVGQISGVHSSLHSRLKCTVLKIKECSLVLECWLPRYHCRFGDTCFRSTDKQLLTTTSLANYLKMQFRNWFRILFQWIRWNRNLLRGRHTLNPFSKWM